jgi:hypothetical protein
MPQIGKCIKFDGSEMQYATLPSLTLGGLQAFSISFWFRYTDDMLADSPKIFDFRSANSANQIYFGKWGTSAHASLSVIVAGRENGGVLVVPDGFDCCEWVHYSLVVTSDKVQMYKNGEPAQICKKPAAAYEDTLPTNCTYEQEYNYPAAVFTSNYIARSHGDHVYFSGRLDSFGIFPWALTLSQAQALSSSTLLSRERVSSMHLVIMQFTSCVLAL